MKIARPFAAARRIMRGEFARQPSGKLPVQTAALPWRSTESGAPEILLITSRDSGRWMLPKGQPMRGKTLAQAAAIEAMEEAGVEGRVKERPIGSFEHLKTHWLFGATRYRVLVHELEVERILETWPEQNERKRQWVPAAEAANLVQSKQLAKVLRAFREKAPQARPKSR